MWEGFSQYSGDLDPKYLIPIAEIQWKLAHRADLAKAPGGTRR